MKASQSERETLFDLEALVNAPPSAAPVRAASSGPTASEATGEGNEPGAGAAEPLVKYLAGMLVVWTLGERKPTAAQKKSAMEIARATLEQAHATLTPA